MNIMRQILFRFYRIIYGYSRALSKEIVDREMLTIDDYTLAERLIFLGYLDTIIHT
jgi:hypothetical protein